MKRIQLFATAVALTLAMASGTAAAANPDCSPGAIAVSVAGSAASVSCLGYFDGNLNGNSTTWAQVSADLAPWGVTLTGPAAESNMLSNLGESTSFSFGNALYGDTIIGVHYGVIKVGSGKDAENYNNLTAFYRFDAGSAGVLNITNNIASISNATLYRTGIAPAVPEPETYAMLLAGLGLVGVMARRRKQA